jgi:hypothetical protein
MDNHLRNTMLAASLSCTKPCTFLEASSFELFVLQRC